jgi:predicted enzyme related to lactoylglutathione lyase
VRQQKFDASVTRVAMNLEVDIIPVSDVERSKQFYQLLGWRLDEDVAPGIKRSHRPVHAPGLRVLG